VEIDLSEENADFIRRLIDGVLQNRETIDAK
jgi:transcription termination factor NusB